MEDILELFVEVYMGVMTLFIPDKKKNKISVKLLAGIWAAILLIGGLIAIALLGETNGESTAGKIILTICLLATVIQIVSGLILVKRKNR